MRRIIIAGMAAVLLALAPAAQADPHYGESCTIPDARPVVSDEEGAHAELCLPEQRVAVGREADGRAYVLWDPACENLNVSPNPPGCFVYGYVLLYVDGSEDTSICFVGSSWKRGDPRPESGQPYTTCFETLNR